MTAFADALRHVATDWTDPDHASRAEAAAACVERSNTLTEPAVTFALNQFMDQLADDGAAAWGDGTADTPAAIGVVVDDPVPTEMLRRACAVWGAGHRLVARSDAAAIPIVQAFAQALRAEDARAEVRWVDADDVYARADALLALPTADTVDAVREQIDAHGFKDAHVHLTPPTYSVAVLDGEETEDEREDLAEDVLLYEGRSRRNVALVWAPHDQNPDPYLEGMAQFRAVVPAHASTPGALELPKALLEAQDASHAYADGLQFLLSRGDPDPQPGAHVRWTEVDALDAVHDWIHAHDAVLHAVVARPALHDRLDVAVPLLPPGHVHRPAVPDAEDRAVMRFVRDGSA